MRCTAVFHCQVWNSFFFFFFFSYSFFLSERLNFSFGLLRQILHFPFVRLLFFFFIGEHSIFLLLSSQGWCMWWNQRFLLLHVVGICIILK